MITRLSGQRIRKPPYTVVEKKFSGTLRILLNTSCEKFAREFPHLTFEVLVKSKISLQSPQEYYKTYLMLYK